ncbi:MAG: Ig-like domain-containing protein [Bacteroidetes bacterium]|nr:Ig-like domain-containing protein [Bacteroidota bacterium]
MKNLVFILLFFFYSAGLAQDLSNTKILIYPYSSSAENNIDNFIKAEFYKKILSSFGAEVILLDNRSNSIPLSQLAVFANQSKADFIHFIFSKDLPGIDDNSYSMVMHNSFENFEIENAGKLILDGIANSNRVDNKYLLDEFDKELLCDFFFGLNTPGIISVDPVSNMPNRINNSINNDYLKNEVWGYLRGIINFYETKPFKKGFIAGFVKDKNEMIQLKTEDGDKLLKPINNFKITIRPGGKTYIGDFNNNGFFYIDSLLPGEYKLQIEAGTYSADSVFVTVASNQTTFADVFLEKDYSIPPSVFHFSPNDTLNNTDTETEIRIVFSIPMDQESTEEAFSITPDIDGKFKWSNEDHVLKFIPENALDTSSSYEVYIDTAAKGKNNMTLQDPGRFIFNTKRTHVDVNGNNISELRDSVATTQYLEISFSKPMDKNETEDAFEIEPDVEGHFEWSADFTKLRFVPERAYATSTKYILTIDENAETYNGLELSSDYIFEFTTKDSHIHPKIISLIPGSPADTVYINTDIVIEFNHSMLIDNSSRIFSIEPEVKGDFEWNENNTVMKFIPKNLLTPGTSYNIKISDKAENSYGIPLEKDYEYTFTTNNRGRLQLVKNYPNDNQKEISTYSKIKLMFNYPVDIDILKNNVSFFHSSGKEIPLINFSVESNEENFTVLFEPETILKNNAEYNLFLSKEIKDDLNIPLLDNVEIIFRTEDENTFRGRIIDEFEDISNWKKIDSINVSEGISVNKSYFEKSGEKLISGKHSGKIVYEFIKEKGLLRLDKSKPQNIFINGGNAGIWIYGDLSNNLLLVKLVNDNSEYFDSVVDTLNWSGWKFKKFNLSGFPSQNISLVSILIKHTSNGADKGEIYLDDLTVSENTNLTKEEDVIPNEFSLEQNYPNPFNPTTTISFKIPVPSVVTLDVLNILGQKIRSLIHKESYGAGTWNVDWDGKSDYGEFMPSGVYLYKIKTADFTEVKKMILVK